MVIDSLEGFLHLALPIHRNHLLALCRFNHNDQLTVVSRFPQAAIHTTVGSRRSSETGRWGYPAPGDCALITGYRGLDFPCLGNEHGPRGCCRDYPELSPPVSASCGTSSSSSRSRLRAILTSSTRRILTPITTPTSVHGTSPRIIACITASVPTT